jgi:hypothetical protein
MSNLSARLAKLERQSPPDGGAPSEVRLPLKDRRPDDSRYPYGDPPGRYPIGGAATLVIYNPHEAPCP